ncbi:MAG: HDIG domain-containing protein [Candidatus Coatesbacteria bacterium]|nr:MAG: HDIG domain-containing protein [Candidatus Coatesbacteria bacterium]
MDRAEAWRLVQEHVSNRNIVKHMLAVEAVMRALARRLGEEEEGWGLAGLLHDLDYDRTRDDPPRHGPTTVEMLAGADVPAAVTDAILAHNRHKPASAPIETALLAADPVTGLIVAAALMHPEKSLAACDADFVVRRFGEKRFAAGADREQIAQCREVGLEVEEFLALSLEAMTAIREELGL